MLGSQRESRIIKTVNETMHKGKVLHTNLNLVHARQFVIGRKPTFTETFIYATLISYFNNIC